jgi:class 3 adenylate cyclase
VTVLFADLKGSMELLADRDPEEARQLLDPVLERMMEAVHRYEDTVNQVMGDGIMALFGAPIAHEDHAVRACYAALAMQEAIRRYTVDVRRRHGIEVQIRVGLNSGEVVVRAIGNDLHMDYTAVGQTTHLAARMEQLATPGSTRLTAETLRLVEGLVEVTSLGPVPVKGLAEPVEVFELVGASPIRRRLQAAVARGLTRFVGRDTELEVLRHMLEQAVQQTTATRRQDGRSRWVANQSEAMLLAGRREEALFLAQQALELARIRKERGNEAWILRLLGEIAAQCEPLEVEHAAGSVSVTMRPSQASLAGARPCPLSTRNACWRRLTPSEPSGPRNPVWCGRRFQR